MWRYSIETAASTQAVPGTFLITYPSVRSILISKLRPFKIFNRVKNQIDFYQCLKSCQCQLTHLTLAQETISLTFICYCVDVNRQKNNLKTFIFMTDRHNRQLWNLTVWKMSLFFLFFTPIIKNNKNFFHLKMSKRSHKEDGIFDVNTWDYILCISTTVKRNRFS